MLARRLPGILPPLKLAESIAVTKIHWAVAETPPSRLTHERPFHSPHPGISTAGMVEGGSIPRPGEATLAHTGVLFLDEFPEFRRDTQESLRQPLEEGQVTVVHAQARLTFPASFALVGASTPGIAATWETRKVNVIARPSPWSAIEGAFPAPSSTVSTSM